MKHTGTISTPLDEVCHFQLCRMSRAKDTNPNGMRWMVLLNDGFFLGTMRKQVAVAFLREWKEVRRLRRKGLL